MTATSQDDPAKKPTSPEPEGKSKAEQKEPKTVPLGEHIEMRQELRGALDKIAELEARLAKPATSTDPAATRAPADDGPEKRLKAIEEQMQLSNLVGELGLSSREQAAAVLKTLSANRDLTPTEALDITASRNKEMFADRERATSGGPGFGSLRPTPGAQPTPKQKEPTQGDRIDFTKSLASKDKREHRKYTDNLVGHHLAKAMGWDHQYLPIPPKQ